MADLTPAIVILTNTTSALAERIAAAVDGDVHGLAHRTDTPIAFENTMDHLRDLFASGRPIIGICSAAILIRALAPLLSDKTNEPPVVAVSEDGAFAIPLLGGHHGANRIAEQIGDVLGAQAALTTAGDTRFGLALDEPPAGWRLTNPEDAKAMAAAMLNGALPRLSGRDANGLFDWLPPLGKTEQSDEPGAILTLGDVRLVYYRCDIVIGVGCSRHCPATELDTLVNATLQAHGLHQGEIAAVASIDLKADEAAVIALSKSLQVPLRLFTASELERETARLANPSETVFAEVGCHGVSEAAALAATGPEGRFVATKEKTANATTAIARAPRPLIELRGRKRGQVALIGIGPGQTSWRTPEASSLIAQADELVGYGFYIDLLGPLAVGKPRADFPLGGEEDRCRYALEQAAKGKDVAIICSGDAGIYAMGALVFELLSRSEHGVSDPAKRVDIVSVPGVSALQGAAARIGAPLGHDFCAISLSDLLTPREDILRRIKAAAEGDFVIAFYNPVSNRRREVFVNAIDILSEHRPKDTPVVIARSLGRPDECVTMRSLETVSVDEVDMMTLVMVGSSQSRTVTVGGAPRMFTPRGYARKVEDRSV